MSSSPTSRCVTARSIVGWIVADRATPCSASRESPPPSRAARRRAGRSSSRRWSGSTARPASASPSASRLRPRVVVGEPLDVVVERVDAGRGDDPRLAHRTAEEVLHAPRVRHHLGGAGEERAERAAETLRETERDGVEAARRSPRRPRRSPTAAFSSRAPSRWKRRSSSRAASRRARRSRRAARSAAGRVVRVLDRDERACAAMWIAAGAVRRAHLLGAEAAGGARKPARDEPANGRAGPPSS